MTGGFYWAYKDEYVPGERNLDAEKRKDSKRAVKQLSLEGELIKTWNSIMDAEREGEFNNQSVSDAASGRLQTYRGFKWEYVT